MKQGGWWTILFKSFNFELLKDIATFPCWPLSPHLHDYSSKVGEPQYNVFYRLSIHRQLRKSLSLDTQRFLGEPYPKTPAWKFDALLSAFLES